MDPSDFREFGTKMIDYIIDYFENIRDRKVMSSVQPGYLKQLLPTDPPAKPKPWPSIMEDIDRIIMPGITHFQHPNFGAFNCITTSYPAIVADMLVNTLNVMGLNWMASPVVTELEMSMMDWLGKMIDLPAIFLYSSQGKGGGVIQTSSSESNFIGLLAARARKLEQLKAEHPEWDEAYILPRLTMYCSEQSHSSAKRAGLLGNVKVKSITPSNVNVLTLDLAKTQIESDLQEGLIPFYIILTFGTTSSCTFDDLSAIGPFCNENKIWVHVDAAYAGAARICPEYRYLMNGIETADTFCLNAHKWLLTSVDCCAMWFNDKSWMTKYYNTDMPYVAGTSSIESLCNCSVQFTRRFRALRLWFVIKVFGVEYLQEYIRHHIRMAKEFETLVNMNDNFEVIQEVTMGLVCFRLKGTNALTEQLLQKIYARGEVFLVPSVINGVFFLRWSIASNYITPSDVQIIWKEISTLASDELV